MNRLLLLLLTLACIASASLEAQTPPPRPRNAVHFELGGSGVVPTFNYERRFSERWFGRAGLSWITGESEGDSDSDTTFVVPLTASWISHPASSHHFEAGGGLTLAGGDRQELFDSVEDGEDESFSAVIVTGIVGYRYQRPGRGFQFRAVVTPLIGGGEIVPWAGLSFGYAW